ncbi:MAG: hypothetical protein FJW31_10395 [Acidobacteria bacterium]|nr:hypothetical protein [Acidobacteriota bacterium]
MSPVCQQCEEQFSLYLYGELEPAQEEALEAHCAACERCRIALGRERELHRLMDDSTAELPAMLLTSCRRDLAGALAAEPMPIRSWWQRAAAWMAVSGWKPALAAGMLMVGFAAGRVGQRPVLTTQLEQQAVAPALVRVREVAADNQGRVRLVLDETRQREVDGAIDDARIRQLLLAAAQDPSDAGLRFASVDLLRRQPAGEDVRRALMAALERDPNPGVRLKALEGLRPFAADPGVRQLLGQTLERDDNSGVRTQAIDLFVQPGQKDTVDVLQRLMQREDNTYIRSRSQRALEAMNASWETF